MPSLFDKRFIVNTGKGGVGKSTISAAMALAFAKRGKRVLLMELNARDKLGAWFGVTAVGPELVEIAPHVTAVNTTPADAMREYALMILRVRVLYRAVFENRVVSKMLRAIPGLPELTMLGKAYFHEREQDEAGRPRWDAIIIDAPATGHGMFLMQIPGVISGAVHSGLMASEAGNMLRLLQDPARTTVNLVTLTEEMPVNETLEFRDRIRSELRLPLGCVVANAVLPPVLTAEEAMQVQDLLVTHGTERDDLGALLGAAVFRHRRCELQRGYLERLQREAELPVVEIPYYFDPVFDRRVLEKVGTRLAESLAPQGSRR